MKISEGEYLRGNVDDMTAPAAFLSPIQIAQQNGNLESEKYF